MSKLRNAFSNFDNYKTGRSLLYYLCNLRPLFISHCINWINYYNILSTFTLMIGTALKFTQIWEGFEIEWIDEIDEIGIDGIDLDKETRGGRDKEKD